MQHSLLRGILLLALALILGFALMGFEMLGSRYLYPYFGGGINTWASLIATVLVALMLGYLIGGALVDRTMSPRLCGALLIVRRRLSLHHPAVGRSAVRLDADQRRRRHDRDRAGRDHAAAAAADA